MSSVNRSSSSNSLPFPSLKRKADESPSDSPEVKKPRLSEEGSGSQLTPPKRAPSFHLRLSLSLPFESIPLSLSQNFASEIKLSPLDEKLRRNFEKAVLDHGFELTDLSHTHPVPIRLKFASCAEIGLRQHMEDAHFHKQIEQGYLMGICDGHGDGGKIARFVAEEFKTNFPKLLLDRPDRIKEIFKEFCHTTHERIPKRIGGTTFLGCYLDSTTNHLYSATLADSEAYAFRMIEGVIHAFPLSPIRNWKYPKDQARAENAMQDPLVFQNWASQEHAKHLRFPPNRGVNVSRAIGDKLMTYENRTALSQNPLVTLFQLQPDDLIVMACDGLWDVTSSQQLIDNVLIPHWHSDMLPKHIVDYAIQTKKSSDNVSVICAWAQSFSEESPKTPSTEPYEDD